MEVNVGPPQRMDGNMFQIFERNILRMIYSPLNDNMVNDIQ
jgi:hypothetical protein